VFSPGWCDAASAGGRAGIVSIRGRLRAPQNIGKSGDALIAGAFLCAGRSFVRGYTSTMTAGLSGSFGVVSELRLAATPPTRGIEVGTASGERLCAWAAKR